MPHPTQSPCWWRKPLHRDCAFDDNHGGFSEFRDALEGRVGVVEVVVGQFLALHLPRGGDAGPLVGDVERCGLVGFSP